MNAPRKPLGERLFQVGMNLMLVFLSALCGFLCGRYLQHSDDARRQMSLAQLTCSTVKNDLHLTTLVAAGYRDKLLEKKFVEDPFRTRTFYHPSTFLPDSSDIGSFPPPIVDAIDEYRRRLSYCENCRQEYIHIMEAPEHTNAELGLLTYAIALDAVAATGLNVLAKIENKYPGMRGNITNICVYTNIGYYMPRIQQVLDNSQGEKKIKVVTSQSIFVDFVNGSWSNIPCASTP
jgi:hypothetical protein